MKTSMKLSIVSTVFRSEATITRFIDRVRDVAKDFDGSYEIVLVNDGSPDRSRDMILDQAQVHRDIKFIELSRNFGHHEALRTGIEHAQGDVIFLLDSDLEEDPAWFHILHDKLRETKADLVCGVQVKRKGKVFEQFSGALFYAVFNRLSHVQIVPNATVARVMTKKFATSIVAYEERTAFLPGLFAYSGFKQATVPVNKHSKKDTSYSVRRRLSLGINAITSFSSRPLQYIFAVGLMGVMVSVALLAIAIMQRLWAGVEPTTVTAILISMWLLGGMIISAIGLVGFYVTRIFDEVKARPKVIISSIHDSMAD